jgi:hypothetical protein
VVYAGGRRHQMKPIEIMDLAAEHLTELADL